MALEISASLKSNLRNCQISSIDKVKAQNGHTRFLSDFSVPKITKVVKTSILEKPRKPLISLQ